jgi:hypothetical protein
MPEPQPFRCQPFFNIPTGPNLSGISLNCPFDLRDLAVSRLQCCRTASPKMESSTLPLQRIRSIDLLVVPFRTRGTDLAERVFIDAQEKEKIGR